MTAPPIKLTVATCNKKRRYSDEYAARAAAQILCQQTQQPRAGVYPCELCRGWHVTSDAARKYRVTADDLFLNPSYKERRTT